MHFVYNYLRCGNVNLTKINYLNKEQHRDNMKGPCLISHDKLIKHLKENVKKIKIKDILEKIGKRN